MIPSSTEWEEMGDMPQVGVQATTVLTEEEIRRLREREEAIVKARKEVQSSDDETIRQTTKRKKTPNRRYAQQVEDHDAAITRQTLPKRRRMPNA
jgi:hypothetical protein